MASRTRQETNLTELIPQAEHSDFFQLCRLIMKQAQSDDLNCLHFKANAHMQFHHNEVAAAEVFDQHGQWHIAQNFFSLLGSQGILPYDFSEQVKQLSHRDKASLLNFFDILLKPLLNLFYRAWLQSRPEIHWELLESATAKHNDIERQCLALCGGLTLADSRDYYAYRNLWLGHTRTKKGLEMILSQRYAVPVTIEELTGKPAGLSDDMRAQLARSGQKTSSSQLGIGTQLGRRVGLSTSAIRILFGQLDAAQFEYLGKNLQSIAGLVRKYLEPNLSFAIVLQPGADFRLKLRLGSAQAKLSWTSWLGAYRQTKSRSASIKIR